MRKIAINAVWSVYSLKGRKGKDAMAETPVCRVIISKLFTFAADDDVDVVAAAYATYQVRHVGIVLLTALMSLVLMWFKLCSQVVFSNNL